MYLKLIKDLSNKKCSCGSFAITANAVKSISIPDDAKGVKMYGSKAYFFNVNDNPGTQVADTLVDGGFGAASVMERRILQDGTNRTLKISASEACNVLVEFWG